jgi:hypothetical protein
MVVTEIRIAGIRFLEKVNDGGDGDDFSERL